MFQLNKQQIDEIETWRHDRRLLREKLKKRAIKFTKDNYINPDTFNIVKEYYELTDKLYNHGFTAETKANYLMPGFWNIQLLDLNIKSDQLKKDLLKNKINLKKFDINILPTPSETPLKKINISQEQSYYIFNLAWTDIDSKDQENIINSLKNYFNIIGLEECENNNFNYGKNNEHIIKYKKNCSLEWKNLILKTSQFIIDNFSDIKVQQNTSVYINKK